MRVMCLSQLSSCKVFLKYSTWNILLITISISHTPRWRIKINGETNETFVEKQRGEFVPSSLQLT